MLSEGTKKALKKKKKDLQAEREGYRTKKDTTSLERDKLVAKITDANARIDEINADLLL